MASVSISGLRRNIKNVAHNYTDAQVIQSLFKILHSKWHWHIVVNNSTFVSYQLSEFACFENANAAYAKFTDLGKTCLHTCKCKS